MAVRIWLFVILATACTAPAAADQPGVYGPELEGFEYPFTTERFSFGSDCISTLRKCETIASRHFSQPRLSRPQKQKRNPNQNCLV